MLKSFFLEAVAKAADKIAQLSSQNPSRQEQKDSAVKTAAESDTQHVGSFNPPLEHPQLELKREKVQYMNEMYTVVSGYDSGADMRKVEIPDGVVGLERDCFRKCTQLEEVYIPDSVNFMDGDVFEGCTSLKKARLSPALTEIPFWGFRDCTSLKEIEIPRKVHRIGFCAFWNSGLERISLPEGLDTIQLSAFSLCRSLSSVELPSTLKEIEDSAFESTSSLTSIVLPKGLRSLGERTFWHSGLLTIDIPPKLNTLKDRTFRDCENMRSVFIPDTVITIGSEVFMGCTSLESVRIPTYLRLDDTVFERCGALKTLTVGKVTVDVSKAAPKVNTGKLVQFISKILMSKRFFIDGDTLRKIPHIYLADIAFQLREQGMIGTWEYLQTDLNKTLTFMVELDRNSAFNTLVEIGARLTLEQTDKYISHCIEEERREMYLTLLEYKKEYFGFDDSGDTYKRFEL